MPFFPTLDVILRDAHRRRVAAQLPNLGMLVTGCATMWFVVTRFLEPVPLAQALAILTFQIVVFGAASILCRCDPASARASSSA